MNAPYAPPFTSITHERGTAVWTWVCHTCSSARPDAAPEGLDAGGDCESRDAAHQALGAHLTLAHPVPRPERPVTTTVLWDALGAAGTRSCCHYDLPAVAAAVGAVLSARGVAVVDDVEIEALTAERRAEVADELISVAAKLRRTPAEEALGE